MSHEDQLTRNEIPLDEQFVYPTMKQVRDDSGEFKFNTTIGRRNVTAMAERIASGLVANPNFYYADTDGLYPDSQGVSEVAVDLAYDLCRELETARALHEDTRS